MHGYITKPKNQSQIIFVPLNNIYQFCALKPEDCTETFLANERMKMMTTASKPNVYNTGIIQRAAQLIRRTMKFKLSPTQFQRPNKVTNVYNNFRWNNNNESNNSIQFFVIYVLNRCKANYINYNTIITQIYLNAHLRALRPITKYVRIRKDKTLLW
jgi:hypothetical protein